MLRSLGLYSCEIVKAPVKYKKTIPFGDIISFVVKYYLEFEEHVSYTLHGIVCDSSKIHFSCFFFNINIKIMLVIITFFKI